MKYFRQVRSSAPVQPFLAELAAATHARPALARRATTAAMVLPLRTARTSAPCLRNRRDIHESRWTDASRLFRVTSNFLRTFAAERDADLGRAAIVHVPSGHRVAPHIDGGEYRLFRDRYQLVLKSDAGVWLKAGDEEVAMQVGELWWFDNKTLHETASLGSGDHLMLVFDLLNADGRRLLDHAVRTRTAREQVPAAPML